MTRRSGATAGRQPASFLTSGDWPDGDIDADAPVAAHYALLISRRLRDALVGRSITTVAGDAGLARSTIYDLVSGTTWPDVVSLAELEAVLGVRLWPTRSEARHRSAQSSDDVG